RRVFKNFPVTISKFKDQRNNFSILDPFSSKEHATIINPEPGKFMLTDHSKNGTYLNGQLINDTSVLLDTTYNEIKIGKTLLRVSYGAVSKKGMKTFTAIMSVTAVIIFSGLLFAYLNIFESVPGIKISQLTDVPDTVYIDKEFQFGFQHSQTGNSIPTKLVIAPFGINGEKIETSLNDKSFKYTEIDLSGLSEKKTTFAIMLKGNENSTSNWLEKKVLLMKPAYATIIDNLRLPAEVKINQNFSFDFDISSGYPQSELMMNIADGTGATAIRQLSETNKQWVFNNSGSQELTIQLVLTNGSSPSNIIRKLINVVPDFPPPTIEFTSTPRIFNKVLMLSFIFKDSRFTDPIDFRVTLNYKKEGEPNSTRIELNPATGLINHRFEESGSYSIWYEIRAKDGRKGTYGRQTLTI
ncbi:MAG: FHA domain-containing protein, partial [Ignavibacteriaceae bacterium]|nr:FHA domain-containing protein [Ignavibacteriaceae bacterium]